MDLKIKDVADLLNISEATVQRWVSEGKIPAYKIHQEYLFSRLEIENWMMAKERNQNTLEEGYLRNKKKNGGGKASILEKPDFLQKKGRQQFSLYRAIHQGDVLRLKGETKEEIIRETLKKIAKGLSLDAEVTTELLLEREHLQPTALSHGIAVPHTRECLLQAGRDVVTVVFLDYPIEYGALDKQPVHTLFFLFASEDKRHLHLLAKIAHLSSQECVQTFMQKKPDKEAFLDFIRDWESKI